MKIKFTAFLLGLCTLMTVLASCGGTHASTETERATGQVTEPDSPAITEASSETNVPTDTPTKEEETPMETEPAPTINQAELDRMNAMLADEFIGQELPIGGWSTPASALRDHNTGVEGSYDKAYKLLADAGLNYMITLEEWSSGSWPLESLASANKAGMKLWYNCVGMSPEYSMEKINALLASPDAEALSAIYVKDEPSFDGLSDTALLMDAVRAGLGSDHPLPVLANLLPTYAPSGWYGGDYRRYVSTYLETSKPSYMMFDYYPYGLSTADDSIQAMIVNLAIAREEADKAGVELYSFLQSSGQPTMREPNVEELRANAHINLAMGVKGFAYFLVCEHYEGWEYSHMLTATGETTALYDKVKTVNAELNAFKGVFLNYSFQGLLPINNSALSKMMERQDCTTVLKSFGAIKTVETTDKSKAMIGCFEDADGHEAYYVVNMEYRKEHTNTVTLTFDKAQSFVIWTKDGARKAENTDTLELALTAGEGAFVVKFDVQE